jgi:hypothetical protein
MEVIKFETHPFKSNFDSWPLGSGIPGSKDRRSKAQSLFVIAFLLCSRDFY